MSNSSITIHSTVHPTVHPTIHPAVQPTVRPTIRPVRPSGRDACLDGLDGLDDVAAEFALIRPRLLGIAHRILGSWTAAEDTVQDAWVRWQTYDRSRVLNPTAFLVTTTTRLAINAAQSARARHESCVGRWLPEPADTGDDPALGVERSEALELGVLLLLERLTPTERAAYVLRHAFDRSYPEIAATLHTSEANARQLVSRAGRHISTEQRRPASRAEQQRFLRAFVAAARHGDVAALEDLFADERGSRRRDGHRRGLDAGHRPVRLTGRPGRAPRAPRALRSPRSPLAEPGALDGTSRIEPLRGPTAQPVAPGGAS